MTKEIKIWTTENWQDYELLDMGEGEKLERFGDFSFIRPDENIICQKKLPSNIWKKASGKFFSSKEVGKSGWKFFSKIPDGWNLSYKKINFSVRPTPFRHFGFFPEQVSHWDFIEEKIAGFVKVQPSQNPRKPRFLNLFGYTGIASLFALRAGAEVTHLDASKQTLNWAKENQKISGLGELPMRIILDDALKFVEREIKRGAKYDAVMIDPPKFGRGPKGETWKIEKDLSILLSKISSLLSDDPLFVVINSYATDISSINLSTVLEEKMNKWKGKISAGELCLKDSSGRLLSMCNTAIWER